MPLSCENYCKSEFSVESVKVEKKNYCGLHIREYVKVENKCWGGVQILDDSVEVKIKF